MKPLTKDIVLLAIISCSSTLFAQTTTKPTLNHWQKINVFQQQEHFFGSIGYIQLFQVGFFKMEENNLPISHQGFDKTLNSNFSLALEFGYYNNRHIVSIFTHLISNNQRFLLQVDKNNTIRYTQVMAYHLIGLTYQYELFPKWKILHFSVGVSGGIAYSPNWYNNLDNNGSAVKNGSSIFVKREPSNQVIGMLGPMLDFEANLDRSFAFYCRAKAIFGLTKTAKYTIQYHANNGLSGTAHGSYTSISLNFSIGIRWKMFYPKTAKKLKEIYTW